MAGALALAQAGAPAPQAVPEIAAAPTSVRLPELTPLRLRVMDEASSKLSKVGDRVTIMLAEPLRVTDSLAIAGGTTGTAEVIHVAKPGMGGKAGELLIAARSLDLPNGVKVPLRSFRLGSAQGKNNEGLAAGLAIAGGGVGTVAAMFITGGSARIPAGSEAFAKTAAGVDLPLSALVPVAPAAVLLGAAPIASPAPAASAAPSPSQQ